MAAPHKKDFLDTNDFPKEELLDICLLYTSWKWCSRAWRRS